MMIQPSPLMTPPLGPFSQTLKLAKEISTLENFAISQKYFGPIVKQDSVLWIRHSDAALFLSLNSIFHNCQMHTHSPPCFGIYIQANCQMNETLIRMPSCRYRSTGHQLESNRKLMPNLCTNHTLTMKPHFVINTAYLHPFCLQHAYIQ